MRVGVRDIEQKRLLYSARLWLREESRQRGMRDDDFLARHAEFFSDPAFGKLGDGGDGACARAVAAGLPPGEYRVRVRAAANAAPATFPYRLDIGVGVCGDGERAPGEECDDSNLSSGDGCDGSCREES